MEDLNVRNIGDDLLDLKIQVQPHHPISYPSGCSYLDSSAISNLTAPVTFEKRC
jgi:hypothetical protein